MSSRSSNQRTLSVWTSFSKYRTSRIAHRSIDQLRGIVSSVTILSLSPNSGGLLRSFGSRARWFRCRLALLGAVRDSELGRASNIKPPSRIPLTEIKNQACSQKKSGDKMEQKNYYCRKTCWSITVPRLTHPTP